MVTLEDTDGKNNNKRPRVDSDNSVLNSPESKRVHLEPDEFPHEFLEILSDSDLVTDHDSAIQDLDSVIKTLQDEISRPDESQAEELGYLLEASDDELGLPPPSTAAMEELFPASGSGELTALVFEDEFPSYDDSFGFGLGSGVGVVEEEETRGEFVGVDGLWEPEGLPAV